MPWPFGTAFVFYNSSRLRVKPLPGAMLGECNFPAS
nr:MAG TPA: hypothetical protein [Caudoviricetes sp.]